MSIEDRIEKLSAFRSELLNYQKDRTAESRLYINQNMRSVRRELIETRCFQTYNIAPPPAVGGLLMRNVDPFTIIFDAPYGMTIIPSLVDMIDQAIGVLKDPAFEEKSANVGSPGAVTSNVEKGYIFIAMPMADDVPHYDDVHDAIRSAAKECGLHAERVDEVQSNDQITDRLLESIRRAEYVIADLTDTKPNVFYEAGYALGVGKVPIYVARKGTKIEFDVKDFPIIFFKNMRELREKLTERLRGLVEPR